MLSPQVDSDDEDLDVETDRQKAEREENEKAKQERAEARKRLHPAPRSLGPAASLSLTRKHRTQARKTAKAEKKREDKARLAESRQVSAHLTRH